MPPVLFADSNVLIEALLIPQSAAYVVAEMVARGAFDIATCQICVTDTEDAIVGKLGNKPDDLDQAITNWEKLKNDIRRGSVAVVALVVASPPFTVVSFQESTSALEEPALN